MSVVVKVGSHQYIVSSGQEIVVDKMNAKEGSEVELPVLFAMDGKKVANVKATIVRHQQGKKIRVVKYKSKSNYHRQYGFRPQQTVLKIAE